MHMQTELPVSLREDTIAAVSSAVGQSGISVIRVSGPDAVLICDRVFRGGRGIAGMISHTVAFGHLFDAETRSDVDEVLVIRMDAPRSYTRENVVEIHCHGGHTPALTAMRLLCANGARPAGPGEFTQRAFLNGRIDLVKAEAVMDLIQSHTARGAKAAVDHLEGRLSERIYGMRTHLLEVLAQLEVNLDYPEYDVEQLTAEGILPILDGVAGEMDQLLEGYGFGRILRDGLEVVIAGKPNVGKSSLMNRLSGKNRSIVTDIPGTTRDIVEDFVNIRGIPVKLRDTAGIRSTTDIVEKLGVERTMAAMEQAHLLLAVFDASLQLDDTDLRLMESLSSDVLVVLNKTDAALPETESMILSRYPDCLSVSAATGQGLPLLEERISAFAQGGGGDRSQEVLLTNGRHEHLLRLAKTALEEARAEAAAFGTLDLVALGIKGALDEMARITGDSADADLAVEIFSRFCIGK